MTPFARALAAAYPRTYAAVISLDYLDGLAAAMLGTDPATSAPLVVLPADELWCTARRTAVQLAGTYVAGERGVA